MKVYDLSGDLNLAPVYINATRMASTAQKTSTIYREDSNILHIENSSTTISGYVSFPIPEIIPAGAEIRIEADILWVSGGSPKVGVDFYSAGDGYEGVSSGYYQFSECAIGSNTAESDYQRVTAVGYGSEIRKTCRVNIGYWGGSSGVCKVKSIKVYLDFEGHTQRNLKLHEEFGPYQLSKKFLQYKSTSATGSITPDTANGVTIANSAGDNSTLFIRRSFGNGDAAPAQSMIEVTGGDLINIGGLINVTTGKLTIGVDYYNDSYTNIGNTRRYAIVPTGSNQSFKCPIMVPTGKGITRALVSFGKGAANLEVTNLIIKALSFDVYSANKAGTTSNTGGVMCCLIRNSSSGFIIDDDTNGSLGGTRHSNVKITGITAGTNYLDLTYENNYYPRPVIQANLTGSYIATYFCAIVSSDVGTARIQFWKRSDNSVVNIADLPKDTLYVSVIGVMG